MIGIRNGTGQKGIRGLVADPGAVGVLPTGLKKKPTPRNIKGLKKPGPKSKNKK